MIIVIFRRIDRRHTFSKILFLTFKNTFIKFRLTNRVGQVLRALEGVEMGANLDNDTRYAELKRIYVQN